MSLSSCPAQSLKTVHDLSQDYIASQLSHKLQSNHQPSASRPVGHSFEAPSWAVPASGEARLEPVCDSLGNQGPVDLTSQSVFRIGRSPSSDVQLLHATSSRKHAMLFHHSNGSCYLVDCGSAHGTFINGVRVTSAPNGGVVVPHRVRRGSLVRFGGPGAPQFVLKSFTFNLEEMRATPVANANLTPTSSMGAVVQHNTRLNSLGKTAKDSLLSITSKRSFDSVETLESEFDTNSLRCSSPPLSPEPQLVRLVSPESGQPSKRRRVSFSSDPPKAFYPNLISPDLSSDENEA